MKIILNIFFKYIFGKLDGKKSYIGAGSLILLGVLGLVKHYMPDLPIDLDMSFEIACGTIGLGIERWGAAHKSDKMMKEFECQKKE